MVKGAYLPHNLINKYLLCKIFVGPVEIATSIKSTGCWNESYQFRVEPQIAKSIKA